MKRFLVFGLLVSLLVLLPCAAQENGKTIITVLPFSTTQLSEAESKLFIDLISNHIHKTERYEVIDPAQRENILNEIQFSLSGCTTEECQLEVGRMLSANQIVVGSVGNIGRVFMLNMKIVEVETGKTISTASGSFNSIENLIFESEGVVYELVDYAAALEEPEREAQRALAGEPADIEGQRERAVQETGEEPETASSETAEPEKTAALPEPAPSEEPAGEGGGGGFALNVFPVGKVPVGIDEGGMLPVGYGGAISGDFPLAGSRFLMSFDVDLTNFSFEYDYGESYSMTFISLGAGTGYSIRLSSSMSLAPILKVGFSYIMMEYEQGLIVPWITPLAQLNIGGASGINFALIGGYQYPIGMGGGLLNLGIGVRFNFGS
jgi:TolB-like protein